MARSKLREEQVQDADFLSEEEHSVVPHTFAELSDVPTLSGNEGKYLRVDSTASGIEYTDVDEGYIQGDSTSGRVFRGIVLVVASGTNTSTIKCNTINRWNGDVISETDNISKGATTGDFTLSANGELLYIEPTGLSGNVLYANGTLSHNASGTNLTANIIPSSSKIRLSLITSPTGASNDFTFLVAGNMDMNIFYITDA